jgi:NAD-dependent dihydropyrimidine dehydrogenase PreA subunit
VFEIQDLATEDKASLGLLGRLKAWAHGNRQAYVINPDDCHACQLCIEACPKNALSHAPHRT